VALAEAEAMQPRRDVRKRLENALRGASFEANYPSAHRALAEALAGSPSLAARARGEWRRLAPIDRTPMVEREVEIREQETLLIVREAQARGEAPAYLAD
jgi:hypothetical protein